MAVTSRKQEQGKSKFIPRLIAVVVALVLIAAAVCTFGDGSKNAAGQWFKNGDVLTWFNSWGKGAKQPDNEPENTPDESSFLVRAQYNAGDMATFAATPYIDDGNSVYLTLLTDPVEIDDTFKWSSSDTSCVIVEPNDGGRSATVTCLQAFGEQITVKAVSEETGLEAVATCDYVKRVQAITLSVTPDNMVKLGPTSNTYTLETNITYSVGTITPEMTLTNGKFIMGRKAGPTTINPIVVRAYADEEEAEGQIYLAEIPEYKFTGNTFTVSDASGLMDFSLVDSNYSKEIEYYRAQAAQRLNSEIKNCYKDGMTTATVSSDYVITYGGKTYSAGSLSATVALDVSGLAIYATNAQLPGVVF